jgi:hypothetical protein
MKNNMENNIKKYFTFLDEITDSSVANIDGYPAQLQNKFKLSNDTATEIVADWLLIKEENI